MSFARKTATVAGGTIDAGCRATILFFWRNFRGFSTFVSLGGSVGWLRSALGAAFLYVVEVDRAAALTEEGTVPDGVLARIDEVVVSPEQSGEKHERDGGEEDIKLNGQGRNRRNARGDKDDVREQGEACQDK